MPRAFPTLLLLLAFAAPAAGQRVVQVPDAPTCPRCRITLTKVATLGLADDPASPQGWVSLSRDSRGRFYVASAGGAEGVLVYDARGRFLRVLGRRGRGPGEYLFAREVRVAPGDSIYVSDPAQRRLTVLGPDHRVARTVPAPAEVAGVLPGRGGEVVVQALDRSPALVGYPLHRLASTGRVVASFGSRRPATRRDRPYDDPRAVNRARNQGVWSARLNRYRVELWDASGRPVLALERSPSWFVPWTRHPGVREDEVRPVPLLQAVREDARGRLWVFVRVPDARWRAASAPAPAERRRERGVVPANQLRRYLDTVVEVLDPRTGRILASTRLEGVFAAFLVSGGNLAYTRRETAEGIEKVEVWELGLTEP